MQKQPLPIDSHIAQIVEGVRRSQRVLLTATPGAGKSTRLPPELLSAVEGQVLVLQPRRLAVVSSCHRVAKEQGWSIGERCGYQVRFESRLSKSTRLVFMTDALLLRRLLDDPELKGVGLVVLDEFHERNLNQDLLLGALREMQDLGHPIKLMIMSATLDLDRVERFLGECLSIDVPGVVHPLEIRHGTQALRPVTDQTFIERVAQASSSVAREVSGDVLVFLPGVGEIRRTREQLNGLTSHDVLELHGSLPLDQQQRVLEPGSRPRVILSTNVAEASVTVPGVNAVVDSGLVKVLAVNTRSGFSQLTTERVSLFSARQRAGRAARTGPGLCVRLWTSFEEATMAEQTVPEVERADLTSAVLLLAHMHVRDPMSFSWLNAPPGNLVKWARDYLLMIEALLPSGELTDRGRRLLALPLPPRFGSLLLTGQSVPATAARMAAILSERDFAEGTETHAHTECDVLLRLDLLDRHPRAKEVVRVAEQLARGKDTHAASEDEVREILLRTQADRLCRRRGDSARGLMVGGRGVTLHPSSQVRNSEFFVALQGMDVPNQPDTQIRMACGFTKDFVLKTLAHEIRAVEDIHFDGEKLFARRVRTIRDLPIDEPTLMPPPKGMSSDQLIAALRPTWSTLAEKNISLRRYLERWRFLLHHQPDLESLWPEGALDRLLEMAAFERRSVDEVLSQDLVQLLKTELGREVVAVIDHEAPDRFLAPSGVEHVVDYSELHSAFVEVRLQEIFGLLESPRIVSGKLPLTFRLLGPNFRPVQVTSDLANFWRTGYHEVRKELRSRYPKHKWPEDPYTAQPEAKGRRRT